MWKEFKDDVSRIARKIAKTKTTPLDIEIAANKKLLANIQNEHPSPGNEITDENKAMNMKVTQDRLRELESKKHKRIRQSVAAHDRLKGKTINKYWININKAKKPRDIIYSLKRPGDLAGNHATRSEDMAQLARDYHEKLQSDGVDVQDITTREDTIKEVLARTECKISNKDKAKLAKRLTKKNTLGALDLSATGKATGPDGLPYELWKALHRKWVSDTLCELPAFDFTATATSVFRDIEEHGTIPSTEFAAGWICPIYKGNNADKQQIASYRPITLLNSDYKLYTKALTMKLMEAAPSIVHRDQAGFMPGRSIFDQTRLAKIMTEYAEVTEENGAIVALDQEKAYDKIAHDYLWEVLEKYNLPQNFINSVRNLYENAQSIVMINGVASSTFQQLNP
ncbi:hypothetical protein EW026_g6221 [Hermanssonia centrifuga]|uniref:Reverse transcriptase domain-containing protein n=1 Tax=Hermanssonia centrifuga TaxID=98765 RepID=A0A4S4KCM6_9APHY|nr:hypothetical protein EW026_g6221 [Hermanssonia centrifuga]